MAREHKIADKLSYQELYKIQDYLIEMSDSTLDRGVTLSDVWVDMGKVLQAGRETVLTKKQFIDSVTINIKMKRLGGFKLREDNLVLESIDAAKSTLKSLGNPPSRQETEKLVEEKEYKWSSFHKPATTMGRTKKLWIKDSCYNVPMSPSTMVCFLERVLLMNKDPNGSILFEGKRYNGDESILNRYLSYFLGLMPTIETPSENTHDENGVPKWLLEE